MPLPLVGYDLYILGEPHGIHELHTFTLAFLERLHRYSAVRDLILEEDQVFEREAQAYVSGGSSVIPPGACLSGDLLDGVRQLNEGLAQEDQIRVHFVDLDSTIHNVHKHMQILVQALGERGEGIPIPPLQEFNTWTYEEQLDLAQALAAVGDQGHLMREIETVRASLLWLANGNGIPAEDPLGIELPVTLIPGSQWVREETITRNILDLVESGQARPALVSYGAWHVQKFPALPFFNEVSPFDNYPLVQRLGDAGIPLYSLALYAEQGTSSVRGQIAEITPWVDPSQIYLGDMRLSWLLEQAAPNNQLFVDFRVEPNASTILGTRFGLVRAGRVFDGLLLFRQVSAMKDFCP